MNNIQQYLEFLKYYVKMKKTNYRSTCLANVQRHNFEQILGINNGELNFTYVKRKIPGRKYKSNLNFYKALVRQNESAMKKLYIEIYNKDRKKNTESCKCTKKPLSLIHI